MCIRTVLCVSDKINCMVNTVSFHKPRMIKDDLVSENVRGSASRQLFGFLCLFGVRLESGAMGWDGHEA